jgi:sulfite exporter TauE/SafE
MLLGAAWLMGLAGGLHCTTMCGVFSAAAAQRGWRSTGLYTLGRLTTYAALGVLGGVAGTLLLPLERIGAVLAAGMVLFAALRLGAWIPANARFSSFIHRRLQPLQRSMMVAGPWALGASTALLPCGLVYAALALPIAAGSAFTGALLMVAFGLGTVPLLAGVGLVGHRALTWSLPVRRSLSAVLVVAAAWTVIDRWPERPDDVPECCRVQLEP